MTGSTLVALSGTNWKAVITRAAGYIPADLATPVVLAHVIDERAIEEYGLATRNLLQGAARVAHFETAMAEAAESAARQLLAEAGEALHTLRPALTIDTLLLRGVPGEALLAAARERAAGAVIVARGSAQQAAIEHAGVLATWNRNRHGDLDGFTLDDGIRVRVPPHRGASMAEALPPGTRVLVTGEPRHHHLHAWSVRNRETGTTFEAHPSKEAPLGPAARYLVDHAPCDVLLLRL